MSYKMHSEKSTAGGGNHQTGKSNNFFRCRWRIGVAVFIFLSPLVGSLGRIAAAEATGEADAPEVWVDVKVKDAERLDKILKLQKRTAELEALERKLQAENRRLTAERDLLRQELFDAINQVESQNAQFRRLEQSVAGVLAAGDMPGASVREAKLVEAIGRIVKSGRDLAILSAEFCNEADAIVKSLPAGNLEGVRLRLKIDEVRSASRKFSAMSDWQLDAKPVEKCRILAVNADLGFVVLPIGSRHGVFNGLSFFVPGKTAGAKPTVLRVFSTRSLVAAAQVVEGDIRALSQGSVAVTDLQQTNK
jgi:hypothetical protein